jgi:hypothetical protein
MGFVGQETFRSEIILKGVFSKPSGNLIAALIFCFSS